MGTRLDHNVDTRRLAPTSSHVHPTQHALAAYRLPSTNGEPFHHSHRPTATCVHQHPCTPNTTRVGYMMSPHHQGCALPPQPSTHADVRPPAPMYTQHNTRWLHDESPPPRTRPSTTAIDSRRLAPTSSHARPTRQALAACRVPSTNDAPFHHSHRPTATCAHQHPCTPTRDVLAT